jgi:ABC-type multidrug transport system fused ATPase/permease subunit
VKVTFSDPMEGVLPEMSARTSFLTEALSAEALKEPPRKVVAASAIAERDGRKLLFVIEDGAVKAVAVTVGPPFATGLELVDGPPPGPKSSRILQRATTPGRRSKRKNSDGDTGQRGVERSPTAKRGEVKKDDDAHPYRASGRAIVSLEGVGKTYYRGKEPIPVLDNLSLEVPEGAFEALMGPSGSGKSTLLNLIAGLDRPTRGTARVAGRT